MQTLNSLIMDSGQRSLLEKEERGGAWSPGINVDTVATNELIELGQRSYAGKVVSEQTSLSISAVYRAVNLISGSIAMMPLEVWRDGRDGEEATDPNHHLWPLLKGSFTDNWSAYRAKRFIVEQILLRGNAIVKYTVAPNGKITSLTPIHIDRVTFVPQTDGSLRYHVLDLDGVNREYSANSILHFRNLESNDLGIGLSTIQIARNTMGLAIASEEASSKLFSNGLITPGFFLSPTKLDAKSRSQFEKSFDNEYAGNRNAFRTPLLEGGISYVRTALSPADVQFFETRKLTLQEVAIMFGLSPHQLGLVASAAGSAEQNAIEYLTYTLQPLMASIEGEIEHTLLSSVERKTLSVKFDPDVLLRTDQKTRYEMYATGVTSGVLKPSEARRAENLPHDPAGDELVANASLVKLKDCGVQWMGPKAAAKKKPKSETPADGGTEQ